MESWTCWQFVGAGAGVCFVLYPLACLAAWLGYLWRPRRGGRDEHYSAAGLDAESLP